MSNKRKSELWIAPQYSLKGPNGDRAWEDRRGGMPSNNRYLELADIALGTRSLHTSTKSARLMSRWKRNRIQGNAWEVELKDQEDVSSG